MTSYREWRVSVVLIFILAVGLFFPFSVGVAGAPIYVVQTAVIFFVIMVFFVKSKISISKNNSKLHFFVKMYLGWVFLSFALNTAADISAGNSDVLFGRLVSLIFLVFVMSPYLLAGILIKNEQHLVLFFKWAIISFFALSVFYLKNYIFSTDLYLARELIGQRMPLVLVFFSWALCSAFFIKNEKNKKFPVVVFFVAGFVVALSLTRAAYIQWFISLIFFIYIFRNEVAKFQLILMATVILLCIVWFISSSDFFELISERVVMLVTPGKLAADEESANLRVLIWKNILNILFNNPFLLVFGTGQVGSSYFNMSVSSLSGNVIGGTSAHSQYLDTLVRSGVIGVMLEVLIFFQVIKQSILLKKKSIQPVIFGGHAAALLGILFYGIFHETIRWQMFGFYFWFYVGIVSYGTGYGRAIFSKK